MDETTIGKTAEKVVAYANESDGGVFAPQRIYNYTHGVFTGIKWQCVEFVRRWLVLVAGVTFDSVESASSFWKDIHVYRKVRSRVPEYLNLTQRDARSNDLPGYGDVLVWMRVPDGHLQFGHMAVVVGVDATSVQIAEQNWDNRPWEGRTFSRSIPIGQDGTLDELYLMGWKHCEGML